MRLPLAGGTSGPVTATRRRGQAQTDDQPLSPELCLLQHGSSDIHIPGTQGPRPHTCHCSRRPRALAAAAGSEAAQQHDSPPPAAPGAAVVARRRRPHTCARRPAVPDRCLPQLSLARGTAYGAAGRAIMRLDGAIYLHL